MILSDKYNYLSRVRVGWMCALLCAWLVTGGVAASYCAAQTPPPSEEPPEEQPEEQPDPEAEAEAEDEEGDAGEEAESETPDEEEDEGRKAGKKPAAKKPPVRKPRERRTRTERDKRGRPAEKDIEPLDEREADWTKGIEEAQKRLEEREAADKERHARDADRDKAIQEALDQVIGEMDTPPEEREYQFSFDDVDYDDLLDAFSKASGLPVIGDVPKGDKVTFKTTEVMDFKTALDRICLLLFKHRDNYWMVHHDGVLEVMRMTEGLRKDILQKTDMYPNVAAFKAAARSENDLVMLIYSPEKGSVDDLTELRDFLDDYVRMAPLADPDKNAMYIFALAKDIEKFLDLVELFDAAGKSPEIVKRIPVKHILPSEALDMLGQLMDLSGTRAAQSSSRSRSSKSKKSGSAAARSAGTRSLNILPLDDRKILLVKALPSDIAEIEELLPFVDVATDEKGEYEIIELVHVTTKEIMTGLSSLLQGKTTVKPSSSSGKKSKRTTARPPGAVSSEDVTVWPDTRQNRLILVGTEEGKEEVRKIVALLDVAGNNQPTVVALEHADPAALINKISPVIESIYPQKDQTRPFSATPDDANNAIILLGGAPPVKLAQDLIAKWDVVSDEPSLHKINIVNMKPSEMANLLSRVETGAPKSTPRTAPRKKGGKTPSRSRTVSAVGKFIGEDSTGFLYVMCTDREWEETYLPRIQELDEDAGGKPDAPHTILVEKGDPADIIEKLGKLYADHKTGPRMIPVDDTIWVFDASDRELAQLEQLTRELDIDPDEAADIQQRLFKLEHAAPATIREAINTLLSSSPQRARRTTPTKGKKPTTRRPVSSGNGADAIRIVDVGDDALLIKTSAEKMAQIESLIAELDVETDTPTEIRVYPFPPGVNVQQLAQDLGRFHGGTVSAAPRRTAKKKGQGSSPARRTSTGGVLIVPQPAAHRLLVSAPVDQFEEIEETIQLLSVEASASETVYEFIEVESGNAFDLEGIIKPMLQNKLSQLVADGTLSAPPGGGKSGGAQSLLTLQADPRGDRLIVMAPRPIVEEARMLVDSLDRPSDETGDRIIRTVKLTKVDPDEMTNSIRAMLTGQQARTTPRGQQGGKGERARRQRRPRQQSQATGSLDVVINPAPGAQAVVLVGVARDIETVEGWIKMLDEDATGSGKTLKIYELADADVEMVADTLMNVVDSGGGIKAPKAKSKSSDDLWGDTFTTEVTRTGKDLYISGNTLSGTMLVAASPAKLREVDEIVAMFVGDETTEGIILPHDPVPYMTYPLETVDAFDAVYTLESLLEVLWPYEDVPKVDYIPFTNILVVKGNPEHFKEIEDLIVKYVDKGEGGLGEAQGHVVTSTIGTGMTAKDVALLLQARLEGLGLDVEVQSLNPEEPGKTLERINPCVLPVSLFDAVTGVAAAAAGADDTEEEADAGQALNGLIGAQKSDQEASAEDGSAKPVLKIRFDDKTGIVYLEGAKNAIQDADDLIKTIKEEAKELPAPPDIRIYRLKHVSPAKASDILEAMFNDRQLRQQQQQLLRQQQQQQRQRQRQQQQQQQRQSQQQGEQGRRGQQQGRQQQQQQQPTIQLTPLTVRVYPNPRERTIIIRAATELYPAIEDLLATVDREPIVPVDYKIFTLQNLVAEEVETQLKAMFGLDSRAGARRTTRRSGQAGGAQVADQGTTSMAGPGGQATNVVASEITITSNASTNTLMAMAPEETMGLIEKFIQDMENLEKPKFVTKTVDLEHADATEVVTQLETLFKASGSGRGGRRGGGGQGSSFDPTGVNAPTFLADGRTNSIIVRALEIDLPKIEPLIAQLDMPFDDGGGVQDYPLVNADATQVAKTLQSVFGQQRGGGRGKGGASAKTVNIVGDAETNTLFVVAPPELREEIAAQIAKMDEQAGQKITPKTIKLELGSPTDIAQKVQDALGGGSKRGGKSRIKITGDNVGKQLLVVAPDEMMPQIQQLVDMLDVAPDNLDVRIYALEHAQAKDILQGLNQMVQRLFQQIRGTGVEVDVYSASADERTNSLVVVGGTTTFLVIEKILKELDIPPRDPTQVVTAIYQLVNANANDLARNITNIYRGRKDEGVEPPKAEANASTNTLIVRGTKKQIEAIYNEIIQPVEENAIVASDELKDERIVLQYAKADEAAQTLTQFFNNKFAAINKAKLKNIKASELTVSITPDIGSNALLVTASEANIAYIKEQLAESDTEAVGTKSATSSKIYPLKYGDPNGVANVINNAFRKPGRVAERDRVQAVVEWGTQSVVVIASAENQEKVAALVAEIDVDSGTSEVREVYKLKEARASDVARIIDQTMRGSSRTDRRGRLPVRVVANDTLNSLIISGSQKDYQAILPLIEQLDQKPDEMTGLVVEVYQLKYADPGSTIGTISSSFPRLPGQKPQDLVRPSYAWGTSALVVSASPENQLKVQELLAKVDIESTAQRTLRILPLKEANSDDLARSLHQVFSRTRRRARDEQPMQISSEPKTNSLMVFANEAEFEEVKAKVALLDVAPSAEKERTILVYPIKYADPNGVVNAINGMYRSRGKTSPADQVTASVEWATQSVIVAASQANHEQVRSMIEQIDQESTLSKQTHIIKLQNANAENIARTLQQVYRVRRSTRRGEQPVSITADADTNSLLIVANEDEMEQLRTWIESLDVKPEFQKFRQIRSFKLTYAEAWGLKSMIDETFRTRGGRHQNPRDMVTTMVEGASNAIVVATSPERMEEIEQLITEVDQKSDGQRGVRVVRIEHADAASVNQSLNEIFVRSARGRRGEQPISVSNPRGLDTLLVKANEADFAEIEKVIQQLDTAEADIGGELRVVPLKFTDATETLTILQETLRKSGGGRRGGGDLAGDVRLSAATGTNSLVISGDQAEVEHLLTIIEKIDVEVEDAQGTPKIIKLQYAQASELEPSLTSVFEGQRGGRGRRGGGGSTITPVIVADDGANILIVRASAVDYRQIESLVAQMDNEDASVGAEMKILTLKAGVNAEDMATMIDDILEEQDRGQRGGGRGRRGSSSQTQRVMVRADMRSNSLILSGPKSKFAEVEQLVRDLEQLGPGGNQVTEVIRINGDPEEIKQLLEQVIDESKGGSSSRSSGRRSGGRRRR